MAGLFPFTVVPTRNTGFPLPMGIKIKSKVKVVADIN